MAPRSLTKCFSIFLIVFLSLTKYGHSIAPFGKQQEYIPTLRKSMHDAINPGDVRLAPAQWSNINGLWSNNIVRRRILEDPGWLQNEDLDEAIDEEPGFDLTEDEIKKLKLWPKGTILYYIDLFSYFDKVLRDRIRMFLNMVNSVTRIRFTEIPSPPRDETTRWVFFVNRRSQLGCSEHSIKNFTNEGVQPVVLGYDCLASGNELAEAVLAIAGVPPQHNSPDRDEFIQIIEENIQPNKTYLFQKLNDTEWLFHGVQYDFYSAGHYHEHKYSVNGSATIKIMGRNIVLGETKGLSYGDIMKLRMLYNYIVNKKDDQVQECKKLFRPGTNFRKQARSSYMVEPRRKPNKYLRLPPEESEKDISFEKKPSFKGMVPEVLLGLRGLVRRCCKIGCTPLAVDVLAYFVNPLKKKDHKRKIADVMVDLRKCCPKSCLNGTVTDYLEDFIQKFGRRKS